MNPLHVHHLLERFGAGALARSSLCARQKKKEEEELRGWIVDNQDVYEHFELCFSRLQILRNYLVFQLLGPNIQQL